MARKAADIFKSFKSGLYIAFSALLPVAIYADSTTNRLGLTVPTIGSANWGPKINTDLQIIDSNTAAQAAANTFTSTNTFSGYTQFTSTINIRNLRHNSGQCIGLDISSNTVIVPCGTGSGGSPGGSDTQVQFNNSGSFGGDPNFTWGGGALSIKSGNGILLFNFDSSSSTLIRNDASASQRELNIQTDDMSLNSPSLSAHGIADLMIFPSGTNLVPYGSFAVTGSSANSNATYSGFTSTNNVNLSQLWSLPRKDGTVGQAIVTDGSGHLSFATASGGGGSSLPLPGGATNYIQNSETPQTATFDVSSGTVNGPMHIKNSFGSINFTGGTVSTPPQIYPDSTTSLGQLGLGGELSNPAIVTYSSGTFGVGVNIGGNGVLAGTGGLAVTQGITASTASFSSGVSASSLTVRGGTGTANISMTEGPAGTVPVLAGTTVIWPDSNSHQLMYNPNATSSFTVAGTSGTTNVFNHYAGWSSNGLSLIDSGVGAQAVLPFQSIQYNNNGAFAGVPGSVITATSVTMTNPVITGSMTVTYLGAPSNNSPRGLLDVYSGQQNTALFTVGSVGQINQFVVRDQTAVDMSRYGAVIGNQTTSTSQGLSIMYNANSTLQFINFWNGGEMDLQTTNNANNGKAIVFKPQTVEALRVSTGSVRVSLNPTTKYGLWIGTTTTTDDPYGTKPDYQIAISSYGVVAVSSNTPVLSGCGAGATVRGNSFVFQITGGSGATGCVATFPANTYVNAPMCTVSQETMSVINALTYSATNTALTIAQTGLGTGILDVVCYGFKE